MKTTVALLLLLSSSLYCLAEPLPRSTPEAQGISSSSISVFVEAVDKNIDAMNSFMLVRHGHVVAEGWWSPYEPDDPHMLYSLSKSFTSTAVGLAIAEHKLSLDDTVLSFFSENAPAKPSENLKAMRVRDLLSMSTGHQAEDIASFSFTSPDPQTRAFLAIPVAHKPGTHFVYNTPATYMCSAIVQKVTGEKVFDYLWPRLFEPLGIEHPTWGESPEGVTYGGFGLNIKTEDIARFGQLYLQKGQWNGRQLVPAAWVEAATSRQVSNGNNPDSDWDQGYGYQFWRCRHGLYRGDGAFGQFCIVMPDEDAVVAITSGVRDMQAVMAAVWDHLLPAMQAGPLPADDAANHELTAKMSALRMPPQVGASSSPLAAQVSGKTYEFPTNERGIEAIRFDFGERETTLVIRTSDGEHHLNCGQDAWPRCRTTAIRGPDARTPTAADQGLAASGAWTADDTYGMKLCLYETPFYLTIRCHFSGEELVIESEYNVSFGDTKQPQLVGHQR